MVLSLWVPRISTRGVSSSSGRKCGVSRVARVFLTQRDLYLIHLSNLVAFSLYHGRRWARYYADLQLGG